MHSRVAKQIVNRLVSFQLFKREKSIPAAVQARPSGKTGKRNRTKPEVKKTPKAETHHTMAGIRHLGKLPVAKKSKGAKANTNGPKKSQKPIDPGRIPEKKTKGMSWPK